MDNGSHITLCKTADRSVHVFSNSFI